MIVFDYPRLLLVVTFVLMTVGALLGDALRARRPIADEQRGDLDLVVGSSLTLLGLLIGFTFSMATTRYDQRKNYEEAEANAIGTEYLRAELLPAQHAAEVKVLLKQYLEQRVLFYATRDGQRLSQVGRDTTRLQNELWQVVRADALQSPTPVMATVVTGMNDVLNAEGYTQASWWNRIPPPAWLLMMLIGVLCSGLIAYRSHRKDWRIYLVLPASVALSFFLIADIDSMQNGTIRVTPRNLTALSQSLNAK